MDVMASSIPWNVCRQGLNAIKHYYTDLEKALGKYLLYVTVTVLGHKLAGKTSLVKMLQSKRGEKILTKRDPDAPYDEATKVFKVEEVEIGGTKLRISDMGGDGVYHLAY